MTRAQKCRIDEEWCGGFIGRRYCSTHDVRWDGGGECPVTTHVETVTVAGR